MEGSPGRVSIIQVYERLAMAQFSLLCRQLSSCKGTNTHHLIHRLVYSVMYSDGPLAHVSLVMVPHPMTNDTVTNVTFWWTVTNVTFWWAVTNVTFWWAVTNDTVPNVTF